MNTTKNEVEQEPWKKKWLNLNARALPNPRERRRDSKRHRTKHTLEHPPPKRAMMAPDENGTEELEAVPSGMFDGTHSPSPVSSGLGWAGAAGTALFAVSSKD